MRPEHLHALVDIELERARRLHPGGCWAPGPNTLWRRIRRLAVHWEEVIEFSWKYLRNDLTGSIEEGPQDMSSARRILEDLPW